jgi:hypothetical protein
LEEIGALLKIVQIAQVGREGLFFSVSAFKRSKRGANTAHGPALLQNWSPVPSRSFSHIYVRQNAKYDTTEHGPHSAEK